jgi:hypothetical protein
MWESVGEELATSGDENEEDEEDEQSADCRFDAVQSPRSSQDPRLPTTDH